MPLSKESDPTQNFELNRAARECPVRTKKKFLFRSSDANEGVERISMPGWSPEIANDFIRLAADDGRELNQLQLQALVYIAHGWCLASEERPLTGDRPEAWEFGPMYRRLADALARYGQRPVAQEIRRSEAFTAETPVSEDGPARSDLDQVEAELIKEIYQNYGAFESWQLSALTRRGGAPWKQVFADGAGTTRDISHHLIRAQFVELIRQTEEWHEGS